MDRPFQLILADDLTGAMEVGLQAAPALVLNEIEKISELSIDRTLVVNTQTRELSFDETQKTIQKTLSFILLSKICPQTKVWGYKIDSTLRGAIGAAIDVLRKETEIELVLVAPALPQNGRVTKKGVHYLISNGQEIPIHKTVYGKDLRLPRKTSSIPDLIHAQIGEEVELIPISTVRKGTEAILDALSVFNVAAGLCPAMCASRGEKIQPQRDDATHVKRGKIIVVDATTEEDLEAIACALMKTDQSILPVGSAGLFSALCRVSPRRGGREALGEFFLPREAHTTFSAFPSEDFKRHLENREGQILFLIGSLNPKTDQQVEFLLSSGKQVKLVELNSSELLAGNARRQARICYARKMIKDAMKHGFHPILRASRTTEQCKKPDSTIAWTLGQTIDDEEILSKLRLVLVTGGETALTVTKVLGAFGMTVEGAVEPFVPIGRFVGGKVNDLPVVTKAGGFGSRELLEKILTDC